MRSVNESFDDAEIKPIEELKQMKRWTWKELILKTATYYINNHPSMKVKNEW